MKKIAKIQSYISKDDNDALEKPAKMNNKCLFVPPVGTLKPAQKSVVQVEKDCIYLQALNFKNAKKKFEKIKSNFKLK